MATRNIKTKYYKRGDFVNPIHINSGIDANKAVATCVLHMQVNHYRGAVFAEVYDEDSGKPHAQVTRSPATGALNIVYLRDPRKHEKRFALSALLGKPSKRR